VCWCFGGARANESGPRTSESTTEEEGITTMAAFEIVWPYCTIMPLSAAQHTWQSTFVPRESIWHPFGRANMGFQLLLIHFISNLESTHTDVTVSYAPDTKKLHGNASACAVLASAMRSSAMWYHQADSPAVYKKTRNISDPSTST
jgi:hypothetical protein